MTATDSPRLTPEPFTCEAVPDRERVLVRPCGELDLDTVPKLEQRVAELCERGFDRIVVELGGLTFMDSSGVACLLRLARRADTDGHQLTLRPGPPDVQRLLDVTGAAQRLTFERG